MYVNAWNGLAVRNAHAGFGGAVALVSNFPSDKTIVVARGFREETEVACSNPDIDTKQLQACHQEADTRIVLHCVNACTNTIVVNARGTYVLLLLVEKCKDLWMKPGTYKKFIPVKEVIQRRGLDISVAKLLLPFHALTGSDTTSSLSGQSNETALIVFFQHK